MADWDPTDEAEGMAYVRGRNDLREDLRPLLERCLRLCDRLLADDTPTTPIPREDMASNVRFDLRRELGKEE